MMRNIIPILVSIFISFSFQLSAKSFSNYIGTSNFINADPLLIGTSLEVGGHSNYDKGLGAKYSLGFFSAEYDQEEGGYKFQPVNAYFGFLVTYSFVQQIYAGMGFQLGVRKNELIASEKETKFAGSKDVIDIYFDGVMLAIGYVAPRPFNINVEIGGLFRFQRFFP